MKGRIAMLTDCLLLAELNFQLIQDEGHRNSMTVSELKQRLEKWVADDYSAVLFEDAEEVVAYALFQKRPNEIYLRHFFVVRSRRRTGIGRQAIQILRSRFWPSNQRLTVDVLVSNQG